MNTPVTIDASKARNDFFKLLDRVYFEDVEFIVKKTGIPVAKLKNIESQKLLDMESTLKARVIGQDQAIEKISHAIQVHRAGLGDPPADSGFRRR